MRLRKQLSGTVVFDCNAGFHFRGRAMTNGVPTVRFNEAAPLFVRQGLNRTSPAAPLRWAWAVGVGLVLATTAPVSAGTLTGTISSLELLERGGIPTLLISLQSGATVDAALAACHTATPNPRMLVDMSSDTGAAMADMAMASFYIGKTVRIGGSNTCSIVNNIETVQGLITL